MSLTNVRNSVEWALMAALVLGAGAIAQAQEDTTAQENATEPEDRPEGRIIQIGPVDVAQPAPKLDQGGPPRTWPRSGFGEPSQRELPAYWLGLMGSPVSPELRAHLDIPEDQGVLVRQIVPDSPAAKAGLKNFDILLRANDVDLHDIRDLLDLVRTAGDEQEQITLEVLRGSQRETVWITPEPRPERPATHGPAFGDQGEEGPAPGRPNDLFGWFGDRFPGREGGPFEFRQFGPGAGGGGQPLGLAEMPNGVSVSIRKENDQPAQITVRRGDESWEIVGDDPKSLEQLPDDLRPFVEQMLGRTGHDGFNVQSPAMPGGGPRPWFGGEHEARLQQRLEAMEQHLRELEQRLLGPADAEPADTE